MSDASLPDAIEEAYSILGGGMADRTYIPSAREAVAALTKALAGSALPSGAHVAALRRIGHSGQFNVLDEMKILFVADFLAVCFNVARDPDEPAGPDGPFRYIADGVEYEVPSDNEGPLRLG